MNKLFILLLITLTGCSTHIEGRYILLKDGYLGNARVFLKKQGTFESIIYAEMDKLFSKGKYIPIKRRMLLVKSDCDCKCESIWLEILNKSITKSDSTCTLLIQNPDRYGVFTIRDRDTFQLNTDKYINRLGQQIYRLNKKSSNTFFLKGYCYGFKPRQIDLSYDTLVLGVAYSDVDPIHHFYLNDTLKIYPRKGLLIGKNETIIGQKTKRKRWQKLLMLNQNAEKSWRDLMRNAKENRMINLTND